MDHLKIDSLSKSFKRHRVLNQVSLEIKPGLFGLLGPNGAGKTTFMRIIATILRPDEGEIRFNGIDWSKNPDQVRKMLGYLPQDFGLFRNITARESLEYIGSLKGIPKNHLYFEIKKVLEEVNLQEYENKKVGGFSGGMRRRLGIAQAILGEPQLIMVDEPTAGLDPEERIRFRNLLKRLGNQNRIVFLSTHIVEDIQATCEQIAVLNKGKAQIFNSTSELAKIAKDKVWKLTVNEEQFNEIEKNYKIISSNMTESGIDLRILSNSKPNDDALSVDPSVEEGYLTWIHQ
ncbi:MAG TPA: ABC transporter ATP-binding protein [Paenibacillaceae bacterium]|nr:ABC transporter ATP-binding protein [Paenibacillaceae bacterium]